MARRVISKASKRRLSFFGTVSLVAIVYFVFTLIYNICTIYDLSVQKRKLENFYIELQDKAETLKIDLEKLGDDKYLADYAREHYLYSKNGEYIIQIDKSDIEDIEEGLSKEINKNYIIIGLSIFMIFVFIYIFAKGKKSKK